MLFCSLCVFAQAEEKPVSKKEILNYLSRDQDRVRSADILKNLSEFIFLSGFYADKPATADKVHAVIRKELAKFGEVNACSILVKTKEGDAVDLSSFDVGVTLHYRIQDLYSLEGKKLGIVRASLNLDTQVEVLKTKIEGSPYIWSSNCFLKGSVEKNIEKLVAESINHLMKEFSDSYSSVNQNKPVFDCYD